MIVALLSWIDLFAIVLMVAATFLVLRTGRRLSVKVGNIQTSVDEIDHAVNQRPDDHPTLVENVEHITRVLASLGMKLDDLASTQHRQGEKIEDLGTEFRISRRRLDNLHDEHKRHLAYHQELVEKLPEEVANELLGRLAEPTDDTKE